MKPEEFLSKQIVIKRSRSFESKESQKSFARSFSEFCILLWKALVFRVSLFHDDDNDIIGSKRPVL